ncbi:quinone oxidoreductase family protein [Streptomyces albipurpureus]|uniref:NADPH:quinone oxidoreductase family protein n=1 Tax=Streptomyces albipurpureus TaxID=2897419 RepID=A0ABT0UFR0_9ACTN|nr:NADPH:quinone oxidoreductase family protein [Streptomyces sp. CWNU-1]MCM2387225.1 NADPH:quinone oxidoreductase family protein [Streptomyces sp. CWNU-1]
MRIIRHHEFGAPSVLRAEETERPEPGPGEVLIRTEAVGVNFADVQRRQGVPIGGHPTLPASPGGDVAGRVESLGEGVTAVAVGDRVVTGVASDAYAEYVVAPADWLFPVPDSIDAAQATSLPIPAQTAYHVIATAARLKPGESVLVTAAAGGIGHLLVQFAKALGAGLVIAAASSQDKLDFATSLGADVAVDYGQEGWDEKVKAVTEGRGVDVVLETVGGDILTRCVGLTAAFGRLVVYGSAGGVVPSLDVGEIFDNRTVMGFSMWGVMAHKPQAMADGAKALLELVASGEVRPVVHAALPLERAAEAHELMEARAQLGRVVLVP